MNILSYKDFERLFIAMELAHGKAYLSLTLNMIMIMSNIIRVLIDKF